MADRFDTLLHAFCAFVRTTKPQGLIPADQVADVSRKYVESFLGTEHAAELDINERERQILAGIAEYVCGSFTKESLDGMIEKSLDEQPWISAMVEAIRLNLEGLMSREELLRAIGAISKDAGDIERNG